MEIPVSVRARCRRLRSRDQGVVSNAHRAAATAARARNELGWHPSHPSLTDEFRHGSYRQG